MFVSEDGTVTGSINVARLDEVEAKTDEAKAQIERLKAEAKAGREQADRDAARLAEQAAAQNPFADQAAKDNRDAQGKAVAPAAPNQQQDDAEVARLQAEAEQAGVTVDKRWGADRLRQEIDQAKAAKSTQKRG